MSIDRTLGPKVNQRCKPDVRATARVVRSPPIRFHDLRYTAGCIDTGLPAGRRYFGQSDKPLIETARVHHACGSCSVKPAVTREILGSTHTILRIRGPCRLRLESAYRKHTLNVIAEIWDIHPSA